LMAIITPNQASGQASNQASTVHAVQLPADALLRLHAAHPARYPVLLQSAAHGEPLGRYDILFAFPQSRLMLHGNGSLEGAQGEHHDFLSALDSDWQRAKAPATTHSLPFTGGWFVFLSYEFAQQIEPTLSLPRDPSRMLAQALRIPAAIIVRHEDATAWLVVEAEHATLQAVLLKDIASLPSVHVEDLPSALLASELEEEAPELYLKAVERAQEHIRAGDIYQANLSRAWRATLAEGVQPHHVYTQLRRANPAPFAALAVLDDVSIVSSTPEP
jgi:anthranilate synthase component 1